MFQKGVSGNPGGRPKGLQKRVRQACGQDGKALVEMLLKIAHDTEESTRNRLVAIKELLDRGWGKPVQELSGTVDVPKTLKIELTDATPPDTESSLS